MKRGEYAGDDTASTTKVNETDKVVWFKTTFTHEIFLLSLDKEQSKANPKTNKLKQF